jgi:hypothetical protein
VLQIKHGVPIDQVLYTPQVPENHMSSIMDLSVLGTDRITDNSSSMLKVLPTRQE